MNWLLVAACVGVTMCSLVGKLWKCFLRLPNTQPPLSHHLPWMGTSFVAATDSNNSSLLRYGSELVFHVSTFYFLLMKQRVFQQNCGCSWKVFETNFCLFQAQKAVQKPLVYILSIHRGTSPCLVPDLLQVCRQKLGQLGPPPPLIGLNLSPRNLSILLLNSCLRWNLLKASGTTGRKSVHLGESAETQPQK